MSRIFRSLSGPESGRTDEIDLRARPMAAPRQGRPAGGFADAAGLSPGASRQNVVGGAETALAEARRVLEDANRQAEQVQRDAWRAGFEQGEKAGERLALQKVEPVLASLGELVAGMRHERENLVRLHQPELVNIAFAIAQRVVRAELAAAPEAVTRAVEDALARVGVRDEIRIYVSPQDAALVERYLQEARPGGVESGHLKLEPDASIARGGCRLESEAGTIDATIEGQMRALRSALWED